MEPPAPVISSPANGSASSIIRCAVPLTRSAIHAPLRSGGDHRGAASHPRRLARHSRESGNPTLPVLCSHPLTRPHEHRIASADAQSGGRAPLAHRNLEKIGATPDHQRLTDGSSGIALDRTAQAMGTYVHSQRPARRRELLPADVGDGVPEVVNVEDFAPEAAPRPASAAARVRPPACRGEGRAGPAPRRPPREQRPAP